MWLAVRDLSPAIKDALKEVSRMREVGHKELNELIDDNMWLDAGYYYSRRPISWFKIIEAAGLMNEVIKDELMPYLLGSE